MILRMAKIRVIGPRDRLPNAIRALQDFGLVHLAEHPPSETSDVMRLEPRGRRRRRQLARLLDDADVALDALGIRERAVPGNGAPPSVRQLATWARHARTARRDIARIVDAEQHLSEERALIHRYRDLLDVLGPELRRINGASHVVTHAVVVPAAERHAVESAITAMGRQAGAEIEITARPLRTGDLAVLIVMPTGAAERVERLLTDARLPEVPLPAAFQARSLTEAVPRMLERLEAIPREEAELQRGRRALEREHGRELQRARAAVHDALASLEAMERCGVTDRTFALDGWVPAVHTQRLIETLAREVGPLAVVQELARESWIGENAPVVLQNPRLFRPFEAIVRLMPLPRYGSIDPTPFVAVFFPVLFGLMLADIGYGLLLLVLGALLAIRSKPGTIARTAAGIILPCALFALIGGALFGELFGDLGRRALGLRPILFDREEAMVSFFLVAIGLGFVHVVLGLILGALAKWRKEPKHAIGSGLAALMIALVALALLAAVKVLPHALLTPATIALLVAFPILVALEGILAPLELLSAIGNILSYARVMALGLASVMLAVVANRMAGAVGSAIVGFVFALLFHLVNFAIGLFSPTIHALRLHYVEFFGKFYSPGGMPYHPFAHWRATSASASS